jgi:hypothetical protein
MAVVDWPGMDADPRTPTTLIMITQHDHDDVCVVW